MNEVNAIVTTGAGLDGSSVLLAGREAGGRQDAGFTSSPPLAGRRCPSCHSAALYWAFNLQGCLKCGLVLIKDTGERSGPANKELNDRA